MLKKGDTIKCSDKYEAGEIADALSKQGIDWDFCYEKNGVKGIWIDIIYMRLYMRVFLKSLIST